MDRPTIKTPILSSAQRETALAWLEPRTPACCSSPKLSLRDNVIGLPALAPRGAMFPALVVCCDGCAMMRLVSPGVIPGLDLS